MSVDEVIALLQEAKEHGIDGRSNIECIFDKTIACYISDVKYDSKRVIINIESYE